jgi:hypothetical protein
MGFSNSLSAPTLSGSTITSSRYRTRQALLRSDGRLLLIIRGQIEYIWSGKTSFGVPFPRVPAFWRTILMDRQLSYCSFWCGRLSIATAHPILHAMKNRYWPLWFLLWQFVGRYPSPLGPCLLQACPTFQTVSFYPAYTKPVRNARFSDTERHSCPSLDVRFMVSQLFPCQRDSRCEGAVWIPTLYYTFATLFAQLAITLRLVTTSCQLTPTAYDAPRVYAVTGRNRWIASCLYFTSFVQVAVGIGSSIRYRLRPGTISHSSL